MVEVKEMRRESNIREPPTILLQYRLGPCSHLGPGVSPRHHAEYMYETEDRHDFKWMALPTQRCPSKLVPRYRPFCWALHSPMEGGQHALPGSWMIPGLQWERLLVMWGSVLKTTHPRLVRTLTFACYGSPNCEDARNLGETQRTPAQPRTHQTLKCT